MVLNHELMTGDIFRLAIILETFIIWKYEEFYEPAGYTDFTVNTRGPDL